VFINENPCPITRITVISDVMHLYSYAYVLQLSSSHPNNKRSFYVRVNLHRNKFLHNKTN